MSINTIDIVGEQVFEALVEGYSLKINIKNKTVSCGKYIANLTESGIKFITHKLKESKIVCDGCNKAKKNYSIKNKSIGFYLCKKCFNKHQKKPDPAINQIYLETRGID